jgi:hypothetical protein
MSDTITRWRHYKSRHYTKIQGGSNMTGTDSACLHKNQSRSYLNHLVYTYLLTPWSTVPLEKLTVNFAASQEIPRICGTRKFLTVTASARHLPLSWANSIQSPRPPPTSWRSILILSSHLRLGLLKYIHSCYMIAGLNLFSAIPKFFCGNIS